MTPFPKLPHMSILTIALFLVIAVGLLLVLTKSAAAETPLGPVTLPPIAITPVDAEKGRELFVSKACVACHSVNGVGGKAAPMLDAAAGNQDVDILDFFARMWKGADAMVILQRRELGYSIDLTASEIGDLAAFVSSLEHQKGFSMEEVPIYLRDWFVDDPKDWGKELPRFNQ